MKILSDYFSFLFFEYLVFFNMRFTGLAREIYTACKKVFSHACSTVRWKHEGMADMMSVSIALWQRAGNEERSRNSCLMGICVLQSVNMGPCNKQGFAVR
jgi:hypothetical protein